MTMTEPQRYFRPLLAGGESHHRSRAELLRLVQHIVADGEVVADEATFLQNWIIENESVGDSWPANVLYARLEAMLSDGVLDADEQRELLATLLRFVELRQTAERNRAEVDSLLEPAPLPSVSPFDTPAPPITHAGRLFVLTGDFASARRRDVAALILRLGGKLAEDVSHATDFLVVGDLGAAARNVTRETPMIERALQLRRDGAAIRIVSEQHWHAIATRAAAP